MPTSLGELRDRGGRSSGVRTPMITVARHGGADCVAPGRRPSQRAVRPRGSERRRVTEVDLKGRLSDPLDTAEHLVAQGSERIDARGEGADPVRIRPAKNLPEGPQEEEGRLSKPPQRRLSPTDIDELVEAYRAGASIGQLAVESSVRRTTVAGHLDRLGVPRHSEQSAWDDRRLAEATRLYVVGLSLADFADRFGVDPQTVANRFRRAGVPVRPRQGWSSRVCSAHQRR